MTRPPLCPDAALYRKMLNGALQPREVEALARHVDKCATCTDTVAKLGDTLAGALPPKASTSANEEQRRIEQLVKRCQAASKANDSATSAGLSGDFTPPAPEANDTDLGFLSPPQSAGELGRLGGYRIMRVLGQGGMGMVLEAVDLRLRRKVAMKVMKPEIAVKETHRQRFLREAQAAAAVEHDHIVPIFQIGEENGIPFIAMPFLKGEPLDARLKRARLDVPEIITIGRQTAEGLAAAHAQGLIHRDIKPGNIWLESNPSSTFRVKILDFGLARLSSDELHLTQSGAIMGTPAYMAPEQARGKQVDHRADLFSLGCIMYEMCTGQRAFTGSDTMAILTALALDTPTEPSEVNRQIPPALSRLVMHLLEKEPGRRCASAREVVDALRKQMPDNTVVVVSQSSPIAESSSPWADIDASMTELPAESESVQIGKSGIYKPTAGKSSARNLPAGKSSANKIAAASKSGSGTRPIVAEAKRKKSRIPLLVASGFVVALLAAAGIFFLQPKEGKEGVIRVEINSPSIEVVLTKTGAVIKGASPQDIKVEAGEQTFKIKRGDLEFETDKFILKKGETVAVKIELLPGKLEVVQVLQGDKVIAKKETKAVALRPTPPKKEDKPDDVVQNSPPTIRNGSQSIDLLTKIDPVKDARKGTWTMEKGALIIPAHHASLEVPIVVPAAYRIDAKVELLAGENQITFGIPVNGHSCMVILNAHRGSGFSLYSVDGKDFGGRGQDSFKIGGIYEISVVVSPTRIQVIIDNKSIIDWQGNAAQLSAPLESWKVGPNALWIGNWATTYRISKLTLTTLEEPAKIDSPVKPNIDVAAGPLDKLQRKNIPLVDLANAGSGDPEKAAKELVAVFGDSRWATWGGPSPSISDDGKRVLTRANYSPTIWDVKEGRIIWTPPPPYGGYFAMSPDGKLLVTRNGGSPHTITLWDIDTQKIKRVLKDKLPSPAAIRFSANGRLLYAWNNEVLIFDVTTGNLLPAPKPTNDVTRLVPSHDAKTIALTTSDGTISIYSGDFTSPRTTFKHDKSIQAMSLSPDGSSLAVSTLSGSDSLDFTMYDTTTGAKKYGTTYSNKNMSGHQRGDLYFDANNETVNFTASGNLGVWTAKGAGDERALNKGRYADWKFSPNGKWLVGSDIYSGNGFRVCDSDGKSVAGRDDYYCPVYSVAFDPRGRSLAAGLAGRADLWKFDESGKTIGPLELKTKGFSEIHNLAFAPDGQSLLMGGQGPRLFDVITGGVLPKSEVLKDPSHTVALSLDGRLAVIGGGKPVVWNLQTDAIRPLGTQEIHRVAISADGKFALSRALADATAICWDLHTFQPRWRLLEQPAKTTSFAISPDGKIVAVGLANGEVLICDAESGAVRQVFSAHTGSATALAFSPDGRTLASAGSDRAVRFWNPILGEKKREIVLGANGNINDIAYSPDGRHLATANNNGTAYILRLEEATQAVAEQQSSIYDQVVSPDFEWTPPENLGPKVNDSTDDFHPTVSADGLILVFASKRSGVVDLFECRRDSVNEAFGAVKALNINSPSVDHDPFLSPDGLTLLYATTQPHPGAQGKADLYITRRKDRASLWDGPENLGPLINTEYQEWGPTMSPDGLTLMFHSDRPGGQGGFDIWMTKRKTPTAAFEAPINLGPDINTSKQEDRPRICSDGKTLLFNRQAIIIAHPTTGDNWKTSKLVLAGDNAGDRDGLLSADGKTLYFSSERAGGQGNRDLWQTRRVPKRKADGFVSLFNGKDLTGWATAEGDQGNWKIIEGAITCIGDRSHLLTTRDDFDDFHLRVEAKVNETGNSGVYFRVNKKGDRGGFPDGFEAQIYCGPGGEPQKTGSLYNLAKVMEQLVQPDTWFTMEVLAEGPRIRILVDGKEVVDYIDPNRKWVKGNIALQHINAATRVAFRKIEIKTGEK